MRSHDVILQVLHFAIFLSPLGIGYQNDSEPPQRSVRPPHLAESNQDQPRSGNGRIAFSGNVALGHEQLAQALLQDSPTIQINGVVDDHRELRSDIDRIKRAYHALGYFDVHVVPRFPLSNARDDLLVEFRIEEGERYMVRKIVFIGKTPVSESVLRDGMQLKESALFDEARLDNDIARMLIACRTRGYILLTIGTEPRFLEELHQFDLVIEVRNWQGDSMHRVGAVSAVGNHMLSDDELLHGLSLRKDAPLDVDALIADRDRILARYRDRGLANVKVVPVMTRATPLPEAEDESCTVDFKYEIDEGTAAPGKSQRCSPREPAIGESLPSDLRSCSLPCDSRRPGLPTRHTALRGIFIFC